MKVNVEVPERVKEVAVRVLAPLVSFEKPSARAGGADVLEIRAGWPEEWGAPFGTVKLRAEVPPEWVGRRVLEIAHGSFVVKNLGETEETEEGAVWLALGNALDVAPDREAAEAHAADLEAEIARLRREATDDSELQTAWNGVDYMLHLAAGAYDVYGGSGAMRAEIAAVRAWTENAVRIIEDWFDGEGQGDYIELPERPRVMSYALLGESRIFVNRHGANPRQDALQGLDAQRIESECAKWEAQLDVYDTALAEWQSAVPQDDPELTAQLAAVRAWLDAQAVQTA